jgi:uncharacterized beta-barrel protein YwiB (DUF1934 family)
LDVLGESEMKEDIKIKFKMKMTQNKEEQIVEFESVGKRYFKEKSIYLIFEEPVMEMNTSNRVTCIVNSDQLTIIRKGFIEMSQLFHINDVTIGSFQNQYGKIETKVYTKYFHYLDEEIKLDYDMIYDDEIVGHYKLVIQIKGVV